MGLCLFCKLRKHEGNLVLLHLLRTEGGPQKTPPSCTPDSSCAIDASRAYLGWQIEAALSSWEPSSFEVEQQAV